jgi:hypothetical protein
MEHLPNFTIIWVYFGQPIVLECPFVSMRFNHSKSGCDIIASNNLDTPTVSTESEIPARFFVKNEKDKEIEILLVSAVSPDNLTWKVLANAALYPTGINNKPIIEIITILFTADSTM